MCALNLKPGNSFHLWVDSHFVYVCHYLISLIRCCLTVSVLHPCCTLLCHPSQTLDIIITNCHFSARHFDLDDSVISMLNCFLQDVTQLKDVTITSSHQPLKNWWIQTCSCSSGQRVRGDMLQNINRTNKLRKYFWYILEEICLFVNDALMNYEFEFGSCHIYMRVFELSLCLVAAMTLKQEEVVRANINLMSRWNYEMKHFIGTFCIFKDSL